MQHAYCCVGCGHDALLLQAFAACVSCSTTHTCVLSTPRYVYIPTVQIFLQLPSVCSPNPTSAPCNHQTALPCTTQEGCMTCPDNVLCVVINTKHMQVIQWCCWPVLPADMVTLHTGLLRPTAVAGQLQLPLPCRFQHLQHPRCSSIPALKHWHQQTQPAQPQQQQCQHRQRCGRPQLAVVQQRWPCRLVLQPSSAQRPGVCRAAASSQAFSDDSNSSRTASSSNGGGVFAAAATFTEGLADTGAELQDLVKRFLSLWRQFLPMLSLFFCLSFINTILDSLKDTLVITAVGGGAFVIPYLTVYAVLPMSMVFLVLFSAASQRMSRSALFNAIVAVFVAFFAVFALFLYPNADALHPHAVADQLQQVRKNTILGSLRVLRVTTRRTQQLELLAYQLAQKRHALQCRLCWSEVCA